MIINSQKKKLKRKFISRKSISSQKLECKILVRRIKKIGICQTDYIRGPENENRTNRLNGR